LRGDCSGACRSRPSIGIAGGRTRTACASLGCGLKGGFDQSPKGAASGWGTYLERIEGLVGSRVDGEYHTSLAVARDKAMSEVDTWIFWKIYPYFAGDFCLQ